MKIKNTHATDKLFIGGSNVAANNGWSVDARQVLDLGGIDPGDAVYAIRGGTNNIDVQVLVK